MIVLYGIRNCDRCRKAQSFLAEQGLTCRFHDLRTDGLEAECLDRWIAALSTAGVLADGAKTVAYSYIGPEVTYPIYRHGTIGKAKEHCEEQAGKIKAAYGIEAYVSVNKAVVSQASSAIPVVPLYISILQQVMKSMDLHEDCIQQCYRLFNDKLYGSAAPVLDEQGRLRVDDWEMRPEVQAAVAEVWPQINTENLRALADFDGYQAAFLQLFGFGLPGVDYDAPVAVE